MDYHGITRPKPGETVCGDSFVLVEDGGVLVAALADGLGHGPKAAEASTRACGFIRENPHLGPEELITECDRLLAGTRGAALTVVRVDPENRRLVYAGVGNVELLSLCAEPVRPTNTPGIVGHRIRRLREQAFTPGPGDLFVMFSDGISSRLDLTVYRDMAVQEITGNLMQEKAKGHDDATCIAIRT